MFVPVVTVNLATGKTAEHGQAVGIIAAQSIEPGTQLAMDLPYWRYHGPVFKQPEISAREGIAEGLRIVDLEDGSHIVLNETGVSIHDPKTNAEIEDYDIPIGAVVSVRTVKPLRKVRPCAGSIQRADSL